jgi:hypothetical protein
MKKIYIIWLVLGLIFTLYLIIPEPQLPPKDLPDSPKSDLNDDTRHMEDVIAYYTNSYRADVMPYYKDQMDNSPFLSLPLPSIIINHPPEYAETVFFDTKQSYYLEEIVHPFKSSLFVNGYEWENDVFTSKSSRKQYVQKFEGVTYNSKVTLRWINSNPLVRIVVFWAAWTVLLAAGKFFIEEVSVFFKFIKNNDLK